MCHDLSKCFSYKNIKAVKKSPIKLRSRSFLKHQNTRFSVSQKLNTKGGLCRKVLKSSKNAGIMDG
jgi:hypothetical protein